MKNNQPSKQKRSSRRLTFKVFFLLIVTNLLTASSCKKEEPDDPIPNPAYFDDMSATINGQAWKASCTPSWPGLGCTKVDCQYYESTKGFEIGAGNGAWGIRFHKNGDQGGILVGQNTLPNQTSNVTCALVNCITEQCRQYKLDTNYQNTVEILYIDTTLKIIEGKFILKVINEECSDTILINDGYFKTTYRP